MANATTALFEGTKFRKLEVTKSIAIANASYGTVFGFLFILFSSRNSETLKISPISSTLSYEPKAKKSSGGLEQEIVVHGEVSGLRNRSRKGHVFHQDIDKGNSFDITS